MDKINIIHEVKSLIGDSNTEEAIGQLMEHVKNQPSEEVYNQLLIQNAIFNKNKKNLLGGIINVKEYGEEVNKINYNLLQIITNISLDNTNQKKETLNEGKSSHPVLTPKFYYLINIFFTFATLLIIRLKFLYDFGVEFTKNEILLLLGIGTIYGVLIRTIPVIFKKQVSLVVYNYLSKKKSTYVVLVVISSIALTCFFVTATKIEWTGSQSINLNINNKVENIEYKRFSENKISRYWDLCLSFRKNNYKFNLFEKQVSSSPFSIEKVVLPASLTLCKNDKYLSIEELLQLALFQYKESYYLNEAKKQLQLLTQETTNERLNIKRLEKIYTFLNFIYIEPDKSENKKLILESFKNEFPGDCWTPILEGLLFYSSEEFEKANNIIGLIDTIGCDHPFIETIFFLKGICLLKASKKAITQNNFGIGTELSVKSDESLNQCLTLMEKRNPSYYFDIAYPSCYIFKGINQFYQKKFDKVEGFYLEASKFGNNSIRARGYNGAGYIHLMKGNFNESEKYFLEALKTDPSFSLSKSNYGYLLLASDKYDKAQHLFAENLNDPSLRLQNYRDVILAKAALINLFALKGNSSDSVYHYYNSLSKDLDLPSFSQIENPSLRMAYINYTLANRVYSDKKYYGLEIFGIVSLSQSYLIVEKCLKSSPNNEVILTLKKDIVECMNKFKPLVDPTWYKIADKSNYFRPVKTYIDIIK